MTRSKADRVAVSNFLASLDGLSALEAFSNARQDGKASDWSYETQSAIAEGIMRHFAARRDARLAAREVQP